MLARLLPKGLLISCRRSCFFMSQECFKSVLFHHTGVVFSLAFSLHVSFLLFSLEHLVRLHCRQWFVRRSPPPPPSRLLCRFLAAPSPLSNPLPSSFFLPPPSFPPHLLCLTRSFGHSATKLMPKKENWLDLLLLFMKGEERLLFRLLLKPRV